MEKIIYTFAFGGFIIEYHKLLVVKFYCYSFLVAWKNTLEVERAEFLPARRAFELKSSS